MSASHTPTKPNQKSVAAAKSRAPGFTLLEVLVVAAVIALLTAILLPSLQRARANANRVHCQANLSQLGKAWEFYLNDSRGDFFQKPRADIIYGGQAGRPLPQYGGHPLLRVHKPLNRYLKLPTVAREGAEIFKCPTDNGSFEGRPTCFIYYGTSYRTNPMLIGNRTLNVRDDGDDDFTDGDDPCADLIRAVNDLLPGLNRSRITANPSRLILMGDFGWHNAWDYGLTERIEWHRAKASHNIAFMDGHVEFIRFRKGLHVTGKYTAIPFRNLLSAAKSCQVEVLDD